RGARARGAGRRDRARGTALAATSDVVADRGRHRGGGRPFRGPAAGRRLLALEERPQHGSHVLDRVRAPRITPEEPPRWPAGGVELEERRNRERLEAGLFPFLEP